EAPATTAQKGQPSLAEQLLRVLADQGHNLSHLEDTEHVTVVVTFRQGAPGRTVLNEVYNDSRAIPPTRYEQSLLADPAGKGRAGTPPKEGSSRGEDLLGPYTTRPSAAKTGTANPSTTRDYLLLGDLRLKEGKAKEAALLFRRALDNLSTEERESSATVLELLYKEAQALIGGGEV